MDVIKSCGFLIFRNDYQSFLLMEHKTRWDLPKGHVDPGESDLECALRELDEETGIKESQLTIDEHFRFVDVYTVRPKKRDYEPHEKNLIIFLAQIDDSETEIELTEHIGYKWVDWKPPHKIQEKTIDPLLEFLDKYWSGEP